MHAYSYVDVYLFLLFYLKGTCMHMHLMGAVHTVWAGPARVSPASRDESRHENCFLTNQIQLWNRSFWIDHFEIGHFKRVIPVNWVCPAPYEQPLKPILYMIMLMLREYTCMGLTCTEIQYLMLSLFCFEKSVYNYKLLRVYYMYLKIILLYIL
jgi:hypothetical protein